MRSRTDIRHTVAQPHSAQHRAVKTDANQFSILHLGLLNRPTLVSETCLYFSNFIYMYSTVIAILVPVHL